MVTAGGKTVMELTGMPRPFNRLREADMLKVADDVKAAF